MYFNDISEVQKYSRNDIGRQTKAFERFEDTYKPTYHIWTNATNNYRTTGEARFQGIDYCYKKFTYSGSNYEGFFPNYKSAYDLTLPSSLWNVSYYDQIAYCNNFLKKELSMNKVMKSSFNENDLEKINDGKTPYGYIWTFDVEPGKIHLVKEKDYLIGEIDGRDIWSNHVLIEYEVPETQYWKFSDYDLVHSEYAEDLRTEVVARLKQNIYEDLVKHKSTFGNDDGLSEAQRSFLYDSDDLSYYGSTSNDPYIMEVIDPKERGEFRKIIVKPNPDYLASKAYDTTYERV